MGALYKITFPNGKAYIGITVRTAEHRFQQHVAAATVRNGNYLVCRALRRHGAHAVKLETLLTADDPDYLRLMERRAIAAYGTHGPGGYNATAGGAGLYGFKFSKESRAKMAASRRGRTTPPETKAKLSAAMKGRATNRGCRHSPEAVRRKAIYQLLHAKPCAANTSGVRGVSWHVGAGKWQARFKAEGKILHIGLFVDKDEAVAARNAAVAAYLAEGERHAA